MEPCEGIETRADQEWAAEEILEAFGSRWFGRYEIRRLLGRGGMGAVYLAHDSILDVELALKVPHRSIHNWSPERHQRFLDEARSLARLHHPHLCRIFDAGTIGGRCYIAMAFVEGEPLNRSALPTARDVADCIRLVALAVHEAHGEGMVHRDLKPANILLTRDGRPVVMDFGLATAVEEDSSDVSRSQGVVVGTPLFMPPEQARGDRSLIGPASDVYGLGAVLYWLLTRRHPVEAADTGSLLDRLRQDSLDILTPSSLAESVDAALDAICLRSLACSPNDRFPDMQSLAAALADYLSAERSQSEQVSRDRIRFEFVGPGQSAPDELRHQDCLYLDAGGGCRAGIIDHHHLEQRATCSTMLVLEHPEFMLDAKKPWRRPDAPFTIILHEDPDLDALAAAWVAREWLATGQFPRGAEQLACYVERVDQGFPGFSLEQPFSLYAAIAQIKHRLGQCEWPNREALWKQCVEDGLRILDFVAAEAVNGQFDWPAVDAMRCPGLFRALDRRELEADIERYERKLEDPESAVRIHHLFLPQREGGQRPVPVLLVRNVQNPEDADRCLFFKDWARSDRGRSGDDGFIGLSVFHQEFGERPRRCILSTRPDAGVTLRGLGDQLEQAERAKRLTTDGEDRRWRDPLTGERRPRRHGFDHPDPWYDGRGESFTIVDSPRAGTLLTADEIESIFLAFGRPPAGPTHTFGCG